MEQIYNALNDKFVMKLSLTYDFNHDSCLISKLKPLSCFNSTNGYCPNSLINEAIIKYNPLKK